MNVMLAANEKNRKENFSIVIITCISLAGGGRNRLSLKFSIGAMYFGDRLAPLLEDRADTTGYE